MCRRKGPYNTATTSSHVWKSELTPVLQVILPSLVRYRKSNPQWLWGFLWISTCQRWVPIATWNLYRYLLSICWAIDLKHLQHVMLFGVLRRSNTANKHCVINCVLILQKVRKVPSKSARSLLLSSRKTWDLGKHPPRTGEGHCMMIGQANSVC